MATRAKRQPAEKVEKRALAKIIPYERNARTHSDEQIKILSGLMQRFGVDQPIVVDEKGVILKGHGRRLAAIRAGFKSFPVVVQRGLKDADKKALRLADNQVALLAGWDTELVQLEVGELKLVGYELPTLGFSKAQLERFDGTLDLNVGPQLAGLAYAVVIRCHDETEQRELLERFAKEGLKVEALMS